MTDQIIFGVDPTGDVTPTQVRDAIITCFAEAHGECLEIFQDSTNPDSAVEEAKQSMIEAFLRKAFAESGGDFDTPTKESLLNVVGYLQKFSQKFRDPEVIAEHAGQIMQLIEKLD